MIPGLQARDQDADSSLARLTDMVGRVGVFTTPKLHRDSDFHSLHRPRGAPIPSALTAREKKLSMTEPAAGQPVVPVHLRHPQKNPSFSGVSAAASSGGLFIHSLLTPSFALEPTPP